MSLPASRGNIQLDKGLRLTLWGTTPEIWPNGDLFESRVRLYNHPVLALDMTLERGRVVIKNTRTDGKPAMVRIRFDNPLQKKEEAFTIALLGKDAEVMIDRLASFPLGAFPFYEDKNDTKRVGPLMDVNAFLLSGSAFFRWGGNGDRADATDGVQFVHWRNLQGKATPPQKWPQPPDWLLAKPKAGDADARSKTMAASQRLSANLQGRQLDVVLKEALESDNPASKQLALFCCTALDDYTTPVEYLGSDQSRQSDLRRYSIFALRYWMAQGVDNEYQVYNAFASGYKGVIAKKLMELLHGVGPEELAVPATWERLISDLDNEVLPMRELTALNLQYALAPRLPKAAQLIATRYSSIAPRDVRMQVQQQLRTFIPPGRLPPEPKQPGAPPPASKKK